MQEGVIVVPEDAIKLSKGIEKDKSEHQIMFCNESAHSLLSQKSEVHDDEAAMDKPKGS